MKMRLFCALLSMLLGVMGALVGCGERLPDFQRNTENDYESRVMGFCINTVDAYHDFVVDEDGCLYDAFSGELLGDFCEDVECDGNCYLEAGVTSVNQICDGRVYFTQYAAMLNSYLYGYRELLSGEVEILVTLSRDESAIETDAWIENGYMYYMRKQLREGGDANLAADYVECVCRVPLTGGESEMVYKASSPTESLQLVAENCLYTIDLGTIYQNDLATGERRALYNSTEHGFRAQFGGLQYVDGYLYMPALPNDRAVMLIASLNVEDGSWRLITEEPIAVYAITNDALYFVVRQSHPVSAQGREPQMNNVCAPTIYACDHDGSNLRPVWTDESGLYDFIYGFTVVDDIFYGNVSKFDVKSNTWSAPFFAEIHFKTGEILSAMVKD